MPAACPAAAAATRAAVSSKPCASCFCQASRAAAAPCPCLSTITPASQCTSAQQQAVHEPSVAKRGSLVTLCNLVSSVAVGSLACVQGLLHNLRLLQAILHCAEGGLQCSAGYQHVHIYEPAHTQCSILQRLQQLWPSRSKRGRTAPAAPQGFASTQYPHLHTAHITFQQLQACIRAGPAGVRRTPHDHIQAQRDECQSSTRLEHACMLSICSRPPYLSDG